MKKEIWVITITVNMIRVFTTQIHPVRGGAVSIIEVPRGRIPGDYNYLQIDVESKEGQSQWKDTPT